MKSMMFLKKHGCDQIKVIRDANWEQTFDLFCGGTVYKYLGDGSDLLTVDEILDFSIGYEDVDIETFKENLKIGYPVKMIYQNNIHDNLYFIYVEDFDKFFVDPECVKWLGVFDYESSHVKFDSITDDKYLYDPSYKFNILIFCEDGTRECVLRFDSMFDGQLALDDRYGQDKYKKNMVMITCPFSDFGYDVRVVEKIDSWFEGSRFYDVLTVSDESCPIRK